MRLIWSPRAIADTQRLYRFLAVKNAEVAKRAAATIRSAPLVLMKHPNIGRPMQNMEPKFREWLINFGASGYAMLYRVNDEEIVILAIRHQREAGY
jgi:plasmid stabilization system protein ParE